MNYHCPTCARKSNVRVKCRLEAEIKAKKEAEQRAIAKLEKDREERGQADELAGAMHEFFTQFYEDCIITNDFRPAIGPLASSFSELPFPSPDSITVTTEFGVMEEPANVTTVSAAGPSPFHHTYDHSDEEENNVEMTEDLNNDLEQAHENAEESPVQTSADTTVSQSPVEVENDHEQNDEHHEEVGEMVVLDAEDFDADVENAFIEEFIGVLHADGIATPTTVDLD